MKPCDIDLDEWQKFADCLKLHSWPLTPAVADDGDGWTYSRVLQAFNVHSSLIVRGTRGWLVFPTRTMLVSFVRNSQLLLF